MGPARSMVTARDIAQDIGVSISTVGRALADDPRISSETKARVKEAAIRAGYVGNMPARIMRGGASNLIGLILPDVRNDFYAAIAQSLSETFDREGFQLALSISGDDRMVEERHIRDLASARAAGLIIVPTASPRRESAQMLRSMPHVQLLRRVPSLGGDWFGIDDEQAIYAGTTHLIEMGHVAITYIGGPEALSTGASRLRGFRNAVSANCETTGSICERLGPPTVEFGAAQLELLLAQANPPTAIITGSVHITLGIIEAIERLGIDAPRSLSMIGFGDPQWFAWWRGGLTTVRPPIQDLAATCGLWFLRHLRSGATRDGDAHCAVTNSQLIKRNSVQKPR